LHPASEHSQGEKVDEEHLDCEPAAVVFPSSELGEFLCLVLSQEPAVSGVAPLVSQGVDSAQRAGY
jgi:hypothetical protein